MSQQSAVDEREFEFINIVGGNLGVNQRDLSRQLNLSLGMTNMLIRRLVTKGYIRIQQLDKRKVKYLLTPKGFSEKMRKSMKYTLKTIHSIGIIKDKIRKIIARKYEEGERHFTVLGQSDFALLVEICFREAQLDDCRIHYVDELPKKSARGLLLICRENVSKNGWPAHHALSFQIGRISGMRNVSSR
ncbi:MAG: winged helix-turn-helix transcriptional regulator [Candidatus Omnitrophica bacterium]|nr:winged helix-turn-helix transcriptional regulator [Candidatus Omnitrophota bacterium]